MRTIVAIGCSTARDYAFLAPIGALLWRDHVGHWPRLFLVGDRERWSAEAPAALAAIERHEIDHVFVEPIAAPYDNPDATTAQNVRQHAAAALDIGDDDWVMPSDADLLPLRREFFRRHERAGKRAVCYNSNLDHFVSKEDVFRRAAVGQPFQTIPTCHVALRARDWRAMYRLIPDDVRGSLANTLREYLDPQLPEQISSEAAWRAWMSDQRLITLRICEQGWFPDDALLVEREGHPPVDRLDRGEPDRWVTHDFNSDRWIDAHVHKAPDEHWLTIRPIVDALLPRHRAWARGYHEEWIP